jgi:hypothetical protein
VQVTAKDILDSQGPEAVVQWVTQQTGVLITDATMRDAHQSLLATRSGGCVCASDHLLSRSLTMWSGVLCACRVRTVDIEQGAKIANQASLWPLPTLPSCNASQSLICHAHMLLVPCAAAAEGLLLRVLGRRYLRRLVRAVHMQ